MRLFLFLLLLLLSKATAKESCIVSEFYGQSRLGNPTERHQRLSEWLTTNGNHCSSEQLVAMWAGVKQLIIEFLAYIVSSGLLLNLWLMQKLIQKITAFESINQRLQKKFQALEKLLNNIE